MFKAELQANISNRLNHLPLCTFLLHSTQQQKLKHPEPYKVFLEAQRVKSASDTKFMDFVPFCVGFCLSDHVSPLYWAISQLKVPSMLQFSMVQLIVFGHHKFYFVVK